MPQKEAGYDAIMGTIIPEKPLLLSQIFDSTRAIRSNLQMT